MISARIPDSLWAMIKLEVELSGKTVSELVKGILAAHCGYEEQEEGEANHANTKEISDIERGN